MMKKYGFIAIVILVLAALYYKIPQFVWVSHGYIGFNELQQQHKNRSQNPTFSIILPTYNRAAYLPRAITSVQGQTFSDFELIIVDDGSTDNTEEIVRRFQENDPRIIYIKNNKNSGPSHARNLAIKSAKGKYISILDSDDMFFPPLLATEYEYLQKHPETDVITAKPYALRDDGSIYGHHYPAMDTAMFLFDNYMINVGAAIKKQFLQENNIVFDENWRTTEDYKFYADLLMKGARFHTLDKYLIGIRSHHTHKQSYYTEMEQHRKKVSAAMKEKFSPSTNNACDYIKEIDEKQYAGFNKNDVMRAKFLFCGGDYAGEYYILRSENKDERILLRESKNRFCEVVSKQCGQVRKIKDINDPEVKCISILWDGAKMEEKLCTFNSKEYWN